MAVWFSNCLDLVVLLDSTMVVLSSFYQLFETELSVELWEKPLFMFMACWWTYLLGCLLEICLQITNHSVTTCALQHTRRKGYHEPRNFSRTNDKTVSAAELTHFAIYIFLSFSYCLLSNNHFLVRGTFIESVVVVVPTIVAVRDMIRYPLIGLVFLGATLNGCYPPLNLAFWN